MVTFKVHVYQNQSSIAFIVNPAVHGIHVKVTKT